MEFIRGEPDIAVSQQDVQSIPAHQVPFMFLHENPNKEIFNVDNNNCNKQTLCETPLSTSYQDVMRGYDYQGDNFTAGLFFSKENLDIIQKQIILGVAKAIQVKIPPQNTQRIHTIMKDIFEKFALNTTSYVDEIRYLNKKTVEVILPNVISNIKHQMEYNKYLTERTILDTPISTRKDVTLPSTFQNLF
uniref:Minor capsid protein P8 central region domain-containing protein n=1 Tax=Megaviridae environmental sample TaxID=1737588 RepID=A0A5J6VJJ5_9VIRU|nr:MAG: hypothetical protein [Megaviridae environmental sample]